MTKAGVRNLISSTALVLFVPIFAAFAQSSAVQSSKENPSQPQSAVQIVSPDQKPLGPKPQSADQTPPKTQKPAEPQQMDEPVVTPPAPLVVKKTTNAILIPAQGVSGQKADSARYEERPAVSSSVSVGSVYGYRRDPFTRRAKFHSGVDIKARWGDAVGASQAGTVQFAGWSHGYGNLIIIDHGGGIATHYAHLSSFDVAVGDHVERGTVIGRAGSTGRATSPHLHYEVRIDGAAINPFQAVVLDPSSDYFKQSRSAMETGRDEPAAPAAPRER